MNKLLIKRSFKALFRNRIFITLMLLLIFVSSGTYTFFQSTSTSFENSYQQLVANGNLHDVVIKENFKIDSASKPVVKIYANQSFHDVNASNLQTYSTPIVGKDKTYQVKLSTTLAYQEFNYTSNPSQLFTFLLDNNSWVNAVTKVLDEANRFQSEIQYQIEQKLMDAFTHVVDDLYTDELLVNSHQSISIASNNLQAFKVVRYNNQTDVNKLVVYDGTKLFTKQLSEQDMLTELEYQVRALGHQTSDFNFNTLKGYKASAEDRVGQVLTVTDISSYQAIVSPAYANQNQKVSLPINTILELAKDKDFYNKLVSDESLKKRYENSLVWVDKTPFFIIGIGVTPDYAYPIIDESHPTIDVKNQAIIYVNQRGYERIVDGFRTNLQENYISIKFQPQVKASRKDIIKNELEDLIVNGVVPPNKTYTGFIPQSNLPSLKMVTDFNDASDQYLLTDERGMFLSNLQTTIQTISLVTTTLLIIFAAIIVAMVFRVLISINRKSLATLLALGYSKNRIALTTALTSFVLGAVPALIGYVVGHFMQFWFIYQFNDFWTIPTYGNAFSWLSLMIIIILPTFTLFFLIWLVTIFTLGRSIPDMLRNVFIDTSFFVAKLVGPFNYVGIKTKYAVALTFKNLGRLAIIGMTTLIASTAIMVGFSTINRGSEAYNETIGTINYEYKTDLYSPTTEGGEYRLVQYDDLAQLAHRETYNTSFPVNLNLPHWHVPGLNDEPLASLTSIVSSSQDAQKRPLMASYLDNKIQSRILLDNVGLGINPWAIAEQLMPDNQLNQANEDWAYFKQYNPTLQGWDKLYDILRNSTRKPYLISYRNLISDQDDEVYTYLDANLNLNGKQASYRITGLSDKSSMYNFDLKPLVDFKNDSQKTSIPIYVNKYMAEKYHLNVGDHLSGSLSNHTNRNLKSFISNQPTYEFEVIKIVDGFTEGGIFTLRSIANANLGLSPIGFNGIMSKSKNASHLHALSLYSPSGFYPGTDTIANNWLAVVDNLLQDKSVWKYSTEIAANVNEFVAKYSRTPFVATLNRVSWKAIDEYAFASISTLSSILINVIEIVSISLSIIFTIIVASLIIRANSKRIATLWAIGYRKNEILKIFMGKFLVPLVISILIALPITFGILEGLRIFIMQFGHILIPFSLTLWAPWAVLGIFMIIFVLSTSFSIISHSSNRSINILREV